MTFCCDYRFKIVPRVLENSQVKTSSVKDQGSGCPSYHPKIIPLPRVLENTLVETSSVEVQGSGCPSYHPKIIPIYCSCVSTCFVCKFVVVKYTLL